MAAVKDFSVQEKLTNLVKLQKIDSKLDQIQVVRGELPEEVRDLEDEITGLHNRKIRIEEEINGITEFLEQKKEAIKASEELIKKYEKQSDNVKNSREFEAITKEIEMQQLEIKLYEKQMRDANEDLGEKVKLLENAKKLIAAKDGVLSEKKSELQKIIADTSIEENHYNELKDEARKHIEPRLIHAYDRIRTSYRNGLAVVSLDRDACGGCFNSIPPQRQSELNQHKKVIVCENCGRVLVDETLYDSVEVK